MEAMIVEVPPVVPLAETPLPVAVHVFGCNSKIDTNQFKALFAAGELNPSM